MGQGEVQMIARIDLTNLDGGDTLEKCVEND